VASSRRLRSFPRRTRRGLSATGGGVTLSGHVIEALWPSLWPCGLALLLGRIVLSFLPAGEPGGHTLRELPATLASSLLLGAGVLLGLSYVADPPWTLALVLGGAAWLVRWATSPAAIVPRHDLARERPGWLAIALFAGACVPPFVRPWGELDPEALQLEFLHGVALLVLLVGVEHGLATARRAPIGRRAFVLLLSLFLFREWPGLGTVTGLVESNDAAAFALGAALALAWLRRADRRSALLAVACFVIGRPWSALDGVLPSAAAFGLLVLATAPAARAWMAKLALIGLALCFAPALRGMSWVGPLVSGEALSGLLRLLLVVSIVASAAWVLRVLAARARAEPAEDRGALARGDRFLILLLALAGFLQPALAAPIAFLLAGCVSIRPERSA